MNSENDNDPLGAFMGSVTIRRMSADLKSFAYVLQSTGDVDFYKNFGFDYQIEIALNSHRAQLVILDKKSKAAKPIDIPQTFETLEELVSLTGTIHATNCSPHRDNLLVRKWECVNFEGIKCLSWEIKDCLILSEETLEILFHTLFRMQSLNFGFPNRAFSVVRNMPECQ